MVRFIRQIIFEFLSVVYNKECVWSLSQEPGTEFLNSELRDRNVFVIHSRSSDHTRVYVNEEAPAGPRRTAGAGWHAKDQPCD